MGSFCQHCQANRPNLHFFNESAWEVGGFVIVRCLLCGWQLSRLIPRKRRVLPKDDILFCDEPDELESRFLEFASKAPVTVNPYQAPYF